MAAIVPGEGGGVSTNNPTFTGLLTTPALRLNSTAIIVSNTAPTLRSDGFALVAGDLWYNPSTGIWGFWKSPYWLTAQAYHTADRSAGGGASDIATAPGLRYANPGAGAELVFVESCWVYRIPGGLNINSGDGSNYTTLRWGYHSGGTSYASIHEKNSNTIDNASRYRFDVNGAYTVTGFSMQRSIVGTVDIGTSVRMGVTYRVIL